MKDNLSNVAALHITKEARGLVLTYLVPALMHDSHTVMSSKEETRVFPQVASLVQFLTDAEFTA